MADVLFSEGPVRALQGAAGPVLDGFFLAVTTTGGVLFLLTAAILVYWLVDKRLGLFLGLVLLASWAVNIALKALLGMPRPPAELHRTAAGGNGLPSGHAQQGTVLWAGLAAQVRGLWVPAGALLIVLVGLSRVYLGVHFVGDVLAGTALGLVFVGLGLWVEGRDFWGRRSFRERLALAVALPAALGAALHVAGHPVPAIWGLLTGVAGGYVLEGAWVGMPRPVRWVQRGLRAGIGAPVVLVAYLGIRDAAGYVVAFGLHALLGLLVTLALPWVFGLVESFVLREGEVP